MNMSLGISSLHSYKVLDYLNKALTHPLLFRPPVKVGVQGVPRLSSCTVKTYNITGQQLYLLLPSWVSR